MCLCEGYGHSPEMLVSDADWVEVEFEVALGSGAIDHVCHSGDVPGYIVEASPGSKAGQVFIVARCTSSQRWPITAQSSGLRQEWQICIDDVPGCGSVQATDECWEAL